MELLEQALGVLIKYLGNGGLFLAPEGIQKGDVVNFLGAAVHGNKIVPQEIEIGTNCLEALNDFRGLLGDVNWIRPYLSLTLAKWTFIVDSHQIYGNENFVMSSSFRSF